MLFDVTSKHENLVWCHSNFHQNLSKEKTGKFKSVLVVPLMGGWGEGEREEEGNPEESPRTPRNPIKS